MNWASDSESDDEINLDTDVMQRLRVNSEQMQMEANIKNTDIAAVESKIKQEEASRLRKQQQERIKLETKRQLQPRLAKTQPPILKEIKPLMPPTQSQRQFSTNKQSNSRNNNNNNNSNSNNNINNNNNTSNNNHHHNNNKIEPLMPPQKPGGLRRAIEARKQKEC